MLICSLMHEMPMLYYLPRAFALFEMSRFLMGMRGIWFGTTLNWISCLALLHPQPLASTLVPLALFLQRRFLDPVVWLLRLDKWCPCFMSFDVEPPYKLTNSSMVMDIIWIGIFVLVAEVLTEMAHCKMQLEWRVSSIHKSQFVARMSHELRTPLFGILGCLEMLMLSKVDAQQKSLLQMGGTCTKSLMALIDDILDMNKIEVGKMEFERQLVRTDDLLDDSLGVIWSLANKKGIGLRTVLKEDLPRYFVGDRVRNSQVLINLLSNSVKFTPPNGTITLFAEKVKSIEEDVRHKPGAPKWYSSQLPSASMNGCKFGEYIRFKVTDTGIGLEPNEMQRIFKPFEQADVSIARSFGGSGLGLTISASLVAQMGGQLFVSSEGKNKGTTFQYYIPYIVPDYTLPLKKTLTTTTATPIVTTNGWTADGRSKCAFAPHAQSRTGSGRGDVLGTSSLARFVASSTTPMPNLITSCRRGSMRFGHSSDDTEIASRSHYPSELDKELEEGDSESEATATSYLSDSTKKTPKRRRTATGKLQQRTPSPSPLPSVFVPRSPCISCIPSSAISTDTILQREASPATLAAAACVGSETTTTISPNAVRVRQPPTFEHTSPIVPLIDRESFALANRDSQEPIIGLHPHDHAQVCAEADATAGSGRAQAASHPDEDLSHLASPIQRTRTKPKLRKSSSAGEILPHLLHRCKRSMATWSQARCNAFASQFGESTPRGYIPSTPRLPLPTPAAALLLSPTRGSTCVSHRLLPPPPVSSSSLESSSAAAPSSSSSSTSSTTSTTSTAAPTLNLNMASLLGNSTSSRASDSSFKVPIIEQEEQFACNPGMSKEGTSSPPASPSTLQPVHDTSSIYPTVEPTLVSVKLPAVALPKEKPVSILVAEDNVINQRILELMLGKLGHKCHLAANGLQALKRVAEYNYDLIFMDIEMPELPGPETAKRIREMGITTPIVALSAHVLNVAKEQALASGMNQYITKPVKVETLRNVLQRWIPEKTVQHC